MNVKVGRQVEWIALSISNLNIEAWERIIENKVSLRYYYHNYFFDDEPKVYL